MSRTETPWYHMPSIARPLISAALLLIVAAVCFTAGGNLNHNIRQVYHAVTLDPARLSQEEGSRKTSILLVPADDGRHWKPLELRDPPRPVVGYWENLDTHAVSTQRHMSAWGNILILLGSILVIISLVLIVVAGLRLYRILQQGTRPQHESAQSAPPRPPTA